MFLLPTESVTESLGYHPIAEDAQTIAQLGSFEAALSIGPDLPDIVEVVTQLRILAASEAELAEGVYWFSTAESPALMVITKGKSAAKPMSVSVAEAADDHPLTYARRWLDALWDPALVVTKPIFAVGDEVITKAHGRDALVRRRVYLNATWLYEIRVDGRIQQIAEYNLEPPPDRDDPRVWIHEGPASAHRFAATLTRAKLAGSFTDTVFSFRATRTMFRPYQFKPVIKMLETGKMRLLIADEVGLGKTIEAGLVWTELEARQLANRVLVLCPSSLVAKWKAEMEERFNFVLQELDSAGLADLQRRMETDRVPARAAYLCTIERMRRWQGLEDAGLRLQFDCVIIDEAHALRNVGTRSHALGTVVSDWADSLIFLSATPLNLRNEDLYNLLQLLVPGEFGSADVLDQLLEPNAVLHRIADSLFDASVTNPMRRVWLEELQALAFGPALVERLEYSELAELLERPSVSAGEIVKIKRLITGLHGLSAVITRTCKVDVQEDKAVREPRLIEVNWSSAEQSFYDEFYAWCVRRAAAANMPVGFAMQMPLRVASTCLPVARDQVLSWSAGNVDEPDADLAHEELVPARVPQVSPHTELIRCARALRTIDTKYAQFEPVIHELVDQGKQLLVFTFSRATLSYLHRRLGGVVRVAVMHGGVNKQERQHLMAEFRAGAFDVLLANRVASEGLDFEFCSVVVNYDLPWNPMEVEQRIGRVDRIGQREDKIHVVNFLTPGTIEGTILQRVMDRIGVFERSIGALEPIIQSQLTDLHQVIFDFSLTAQQRDLRASQILAAIEEKGLAKAEVESASSYLMSSDAAEIEGLGESLVNQGRYVGQSELALLIQDWAHTSGSSRARVTDDGQMLALRGNALMAEQVFGLAVAGERSRTEVEHIGGQLRAELDIHLSLDQERSRIGELPLLTSNHPLVRAALRVPGHRQARYASLAIANRDGELEPGRYLVSLSVASWVGLRPSNEIWTAVVDLSTDSNGPGSVGDAVLAELASASLADNPLTPGDDLAGGVDHAERQLLTRLLTEDQSKRRENAALLETRRISVRQVHRRKCDQIRARIDTLRRTHNDRMVPLFEKQLAAQAQRLLDVEAQIARAVDCAMNLEPLAVCVVEVKP